MKGYPKVIVATSVLGALSALHLTIQFLQHRGGEAASNLCDFNASISCGGVNTAGGRSSPR